MQFVFFLSVLLSACDYECVSVFCLSMGHVAWNKWFDLIWLIIMVSLEYAVNTLPDGAHRAVWDELLRLPADSERAAVLRQLHCSRPVWDRFILAQLLVSYGISSDGFPRVIAPAFSTPAFSAPIPPARPFRRWTDNVADWCGYSVPELAVKLANDRKQWKRITILSGSRRRRVWDREMARWFG